jgi:predicted alpha-1,2-mannosidase
MEFMLLPVQAVPVSVSMPKRDGPAKNAVAEFCSTSDRTRTEIKAELTFNPMKNAPSPVTRFVSAAALVCATLAAAAGSQPVDAVDVFMGTSNSRWMLFPGVTLPFGLVKFSPDNQDNVWNGGYEYTVGSISGFSHLHAMSLSGVSLMPTVGRVESYPGQFKVFPGSSDGPFGGMWTSGYRSRFRKEDEKAGPGYYGVYLLDYRIKAELTATMRCGMMQLTFPESDQAHLLLNFDFPTEERTRILEVSARRASPTEIAGTIRQSNGYALGYAIHFVLQLSRPMDSVDGWQLGAYTGADSNYGIEWRRPVEYQTNLSDFSGKGGCGLVLNFHTKANEKVLVRTGISLVSVEQARLNLDTEMKPFGWNFAAVVAQARETWNTLLSRVEVSGGRDGDRQMFYTCLYRAYAAKSVLNDCDGQYVDMCGRVQQLHAPADAIYSSDAFWGAQWTLSPLWTLVTPHYASSWVNFFLETFQRGGWLPEAPVNMKYSPIMCAQHQQSLIVSSYQKGIRDFDTNLAWAAIWHDLTTPGVEYECGGFAGNRHLGAYMQSGFVPEEDGPVSSTMEYAYDDWAAAQFASALGKTQEARQLLKRSGNYRNVFDPKTGYVRRRHRDGRWVEPFDPFQFGTEGGWNGPGYVEGNAWIYTFFVPHDLPGLLQLMGKDTFNARLEEGFAKHHVDLGNEPNLQAPFLFNYSGKPWLTQKYSRKVLRDYYELSPYTGWIGEEDEGQLSAHFVLLAMGLFEMDGGCAVRPYYDLSGPLFKQVILHLDPAYYPGGTFTIEARGNSEKNLYIQSATLNGRPLNEARLLHDDLVKGGKLVLRMGPAPNERWGQGKE